MSRSRKQRVDDDDEVGSSYEEDEAALEEEEEIEADEPEGEFVDEDGVVMKGNEKEDKDDDEDDDNDDEDLEQPAPPKKRLHVYHQVPESTEVRVSAPERRVTSEYMTRYEYAMVIGIRATHIAAGSTLYTDPQGLHEPCEIAKKEIRENKCPLCIVRRVSPTKVEVWSVNEMIKPSN